MRDRSCFILICLNGTCGTPLVAHVSAIVRTTARKYSQISRNQRRRKWEPNLVV